MEDDWKSETRTGENAVGSVAGEERWYQDKVNGGLLELFLLFRRGVVLYVWMVVEGCGFRRERNRRAL